MGQEVSKRDLSAFLEGYMVQIKSCQASEMETIIVTLFPEDAKMRSSGLRQGTQGPTQGTEL